MACHRPRGGPVAASENPHVAAAFRAMSVVGEFASELWKATLNTIPGWYYSHQAGAALENGDYAFTAASWIAMTGDVLSGGAGSKITTTTRGVTILGENMIGRVIPFAQRTGGRALEFGTTRAGWAILTPRGRWHLNDGQLRARIKEGDEFRSMLKDPARHPDARRRLDLHGSELLRLRERGVPVDIISPEEALDVIGRF